MKKQDIEKNQEAETKDFNVEIESPKIAKEILTTMLVILDNGARQGLFEIDEFPFISAVKREIVQFDAATDKQLCKFSSDSAKICLNVLAKGAKSGLFNLSDFGSVFYIKTELEKIVV